MSLSAWCAYVALASEYIFLLLVLVEVVVCAQTVKCHFSHNCW